MIIALCGLSGAGKTTTYKELIKKIECKSLVSYTTRPIRPQEVEGKDYFYISNIDFNNKDMAVKDSFLVYNKKNKVELWQYGYTYDQLKGDELQVAILTPNQILEMKKKGFSILDFEIYVEDEKKRIKRVTTRKDNQTQKEILRRNKEDKKIYENFKATYRIENISIKETINNIMEVLKKC